MKKILVLLLLLPFFLNGQTYELDQGFVVGSGFNDETIAIDLTSDGKLIVAGAFTSFDGASVIGLARLNANGSLDTNFDPGATFSGDILTAIAVDVSNNKVYVAGTFAESVVRLDTDGTIDNGFTFDDTGYDGTIRSLAVDATGKLLAGQGPGMSGVSARLARFNTDGTIDNTFTSNNATGVFPSGQRLGSSTSINHISIDTNGKILVSGNFTSYGGGEEGFLRLNDDGTVDNTFNLNYLQEVDNSEKFYSTTLSDGKVLVSGLFTTGTRIERFNADGSADNYSDVVSLGGSNRNTNKIYENANNDYLIGGLYGLRLKNSTDGDNTNIQAGDGFFTASEFEIAEIEDFEVDGSGGLIAVGDFNYYNGTSAGFIVRLVECTSIQITNDLSVATNACEGDAVGLNVAATGTGLTYQWQVKISDAFGVTFANIGNDAIYSGATTNSLTISGITGVFNNYDYRCIISDASCSATSEWTNLNVFAEQTINTQPTNETVCENETATFTVGITGSTNDIQWQVNEGSGFQDLINGTDVSGATSTTLAISNPSSNMDGYVYRAVLSTCSTPTMSNEVTLAVNEIPVIVGAGQQRPKVCVTGDASFTVNATGTSLTYQWQYRPMGAPNGSFTDLPNGGEVSGATTATLSLTGVDNTFDKTYLTEVDGSVYGQFRCRVSSNGCDAFTTEVRLLQIHPEPTFNTQPTSPAPFCDNGSGISTSFTAVASIGVDTYQWQVNDGSGFVDVVDNDVYSGSNSHTLSLSGANSDFDGFVYRCSIESCPSSIYSDEVILSIGDNPVITTQPIDVTVCQGGGTSFNVEATGSGLTYQWQQRQNNGSYADIVDGSNFSGTASNVLQIANVDGLNNERFRCVVSSGDCSVNSNNRRISITNQPSFTAAPADRTICENEDVSFSRAAFNFNFSVNSYQWQEAMAGSDIFVDIADGAKYSGATTSVLNISAASGNMNGNRYRLKVLGCVADIVSDEAELTVIAQPIISESPLPQTVCDEDAVTLNVDAIGENLTYQWFVDEGSGSFEVVSNSSDIGEFTFNADLSQDGWIYKCRITPISPCQNEFVETTPVAITVNEPPAVVQSVSISNFPICIGEDAEAIIHLSSGTPSVQWQVNDGTGFVDIVNGSDYTGATSLNLQILGPQIEMSGYLYRGVLEGNACEVITTTVELNVFPIFDKPTIAADETNPEAPVLSISNLPSDFDQIGGIVDWYRNGEYLTSSLTLTPTQSGSYTAVLNEGGVTVVCQSEQSDPYVFEAVLSVIDGQKVYFYPNPARDIIKIDLAEPLQVRIFSISGKLEMKGSISQNQELNIQSLKPGQYIVQLFNKNGLVHSEKILKAN